LLQGREISNSALQLDALDGLRGIAVLLVFLSHTSLNGDHLIPFVDFSGVGKSGVFLFFLLSAFLLTKPFLVKERDQVDKRFLLNYAQRRFFRIYPLYFTFLGAALLLSFFVPQGPRGHAYPFPLVYSGFLDHLLLQEGKGVTWSILVEFRYYFVLPILALFFSLVLHNRLLPCTILTLVLVALTQVFWPEAASHRNDVRLQPYLPIFFMGSFLAVLHHQLSESKLRDTVWLQNVIEVVGFGAIMVLILMIPSVTSMFVGGGVTTDFFHRQFMLYGLLWSFVLLAGISGRGWLKWCFEIRVLRYVGFISFSVYLLHAPVIDVIKLFNLSQLLNPWLMLAVTIAVSHTTWMLIEKPLSGIRFIRPAEPSPVKSV